jgi:hypothetical protein
MVNFIIRFALLHNLLQQHLRNSTLARLILPLQATHITATEPANLYLTDFQETNNSHLRTLHGLINCDSKFT